MIPKFENVVQKIHVLMVCGNQALTSPAPVNRAPEHLHTHTHTLVRHAEAQTNFFHPEYIIDLDKPNLT